MPDESKAASYLQGVFEYMNLWVGEKRTRELFTEISKRPAHRPPGSTTPEQDQELLGLILPHRGSMAALARQLLKKDPHRYGSPSEETFATRLRRLKKEFMEARKRLDI